MGKYLPLILMEIVVAVMVLAIGVVIMVKGKVDCVEDIKESKRTMALINDCQNDGNDVDIGDIKIVILLI